MHACPTCGSDAAGSGGVYLLRDVRDDEAENLRAQARENPGLRDQIKAVRERLSVEDAAVDGVSRLLKQTVETIIAALEDDVRGSAIRRVILTASLADLERLLGDQLSEAQRAMVRGMADLLATNQALAAATAQVPLGTLGVRSSSIDILTSTKDIEDFWRGKVVMPAASIIRESFASAAAGETLNTAIARTADRLDRSTARAVTEVRTNLASFDRLAAEQSAVLVGLDIRVYLGPLDSLTRPFCRALINRAYTMDQVAALDNGQTGPGLWGGGGYNCRHRWVSVREGMLERMGIPRGTDESIAAANKAGAGPPRRPNSRGAI